MLNHWVAGPDCFMNRSRSPANPSTAADNNDHGVL
jgi:hypothetical protein